jgi:hypothetical protein
MTIPKEINWETVDGMLIAGCSGPQCAAAIGVHPDTLYDRCQAEKGSLFSQYAQAKRAHGDGLLHAAQFQKAYKDKNPTMLIWLGKQRLNQKENDQLTDAETSRIAKQLSEAVKAENIIQE